MNNDYRRLPLLPPQIDLSTPVELLASAQEAAGRYDEAVRRLINPGLG